MTVLARVNAVLVAPDADTAESALCYVAAGAGAAIAAAGAQGAGLRWWSVVVLAAVAFDLVGGAVVNATPAAKRRFHGPGRSGAHRLAFVAAHVQPFLLALLVPGFGWTAAALAYGLAVGGAVALLLTEPRLRRPLGFAVTAVGSVAALVAVPLPAFLAWVAPVLLVKLLLGHLLPEEAS
ncbi:hypothetical protein [Pseudonocardia sp. MH-G8]|uniref:hypothetical protein n=1 Tax=Pseudonocardia sp. MH-G8 TaxID=1854588 RepID=UPI000B9FABDA|nr:hypothetical protein [Pseudonocardia sp. MH-G8]OZM80232.1 hypothetical protein CFP66_22060 [Pseudonocardia sp. MH-G8]